MQVKTVGLDLAKDVFQVHGVTSDGTVAFNRCVRRAQLLRFFEKLPPCLAGMEACRSSHRWAREIGKLGHEVRLMPAFYVKPYVKRGKTDAVDAAAICEAVMLARVEDLLPVEYFHAVFTLPTAVADIAYQNKAAVYDLLFKASAQTLLTIAADPKHLGARIGMTSVLHTWGSAMTHHPHVHVIVPGGGLSPDGTRWIACRPGFFLPVKVLSRLFRRLFLEGLARLHRAGKLVFFGELAGLADPITFENHLAPLRETDWVVYAKPPFGGPKAVLAYLSRYTHRVAISNHRLVSADADTVAFRWKDYRIKRGDRMKVMRLPTSEFIRRFLIHVLPSGFHRSRHAGFLANGIRRDRISRIRHLLDAEREPDRTPGDGTREDPDDPNTHQQCPKCGGALIIIETFNRGQTPKSRAPPREQAA